MKLKPITAVLAQRGGLDIEPNGLPQRGGLDIEPNGLIGADIDPVGFGRSD